MAFQTNKTTSVSPSVDKISTVSLLQPTGFRVIIDRENYPNFEFFAQSVAHPGVDINPAQVPFRRADVFFPGDKLTFPPVNFTVLMDENMASYSELYNWLERMVEKPIKDKRTLNDSTNIPIMGDLTVIVLSSHNNQNKQIKYYGAFPTNLSTVSLETTAGDTPAITFTVDFRFDYWDII
jgi:hypothetical protein